MQIGNEVLAIHGGTISGVRAASPLDPGAVGPDAYTRPSFCILCSCREQDVLNPDSDSEGYDITGGLCVAC